MWYGGKSKYNARKTTIDGITFDSAREAKRYQELKLMERAGVICDLRRQVKFELQPAFYLDGKTYRAINYIADFVYYKVKSGDEVVEDCKGFRTDVYKLKAKMFAYRYGVSILET